MKDSISEILKIADDLLIQLHNIAVKLDGRAECNNGIKTNDEEKPKLGMDFRITEEELRDCLSVILNYDNLEKLEKIKKSTTNGELYSILLHIIKI